MGKNSVFLGLLFVVVSLVYSSCEETDTIGFPVGEHKIQTIFLDTFTVRTSTVLLDSIATSASSRILVGEYHDPVFGKTISSSFLQLAAQNANSQIPLESAVFDSMVLILKYDKYFYGDTTQIQSLVVNELSEKILYRQILNSENRSAFFTGGLFNHSKTNSYSAPLGSRNYRPRPLSKGTVSIRLDGAKGKEWFEIAKGEDKSPLTPVNFVETFKGIKISTPTPTDGAVIGFLSDSTVMRVYFSQVDVEGVSNQAYFDFTPYDNTNFQYNQVSTDRTGTPLQNLVAGRAVGNELTNNETFIQGGAGVLTKIEFPNFQYLTSNNEKFMILAANLVVIPVDPQDGQKKLPDNLGLLIMNKANIPTQIMPMDFSNTSAMSSGLWHQEGSSLKPGEDLEFNRSTRYVFSIIQYTDSLVNKRPNTLPSLMLYTPSTFSNSVTQLRIGNGINQTSKIKLEIYLSRLK